MLTQRRSRQHGPRLPRNVEEDLRNRSWPKPSLTSPIKDPAKKQAFPSLYRLEDASQLATSQRSHLMTLPRLGLIWWNQSLPNEPAAVRAKPCPQSSLLLHRPHIPKLPPRNSKAPAAAHAHPPPP